MRNCTRDEGGPFGFGNQVLISSRCKLLRSKVMYANATLSWVISRLSLAREPRQRRLPSRGREPSRPVRQMSAYPLTAPNRQISLNRCLGPFPDSRVAANSTFRGRDASYLAPPAQIRTCGFPAYGSHLGHRRRNIAVCEPTPVTRLAGTESSMCFIGPHSPRSLPFAPPTPPRIAPFVFVGFKATMTESDFSGPFIIGYGSSPSRRGPVTANTVPVKPETSQLPMRSFCT